MPTLLIFADHDAASMKHTAKSFALFGGGLRNAGLDPKKLQFDRARLAIVPGYTITTSPTTPTSRGLSKPILRSPHRLCSR